jgi:hypothetical protein
MGAATNLQPDQASLQTRDKGTELIAVEFLAQHGLTRSIHTMQLKALLSQINGQHLDVAVYGILFQGTSRSCLMPA